MGSATVLIVLFIILSFHFDSSLSLRCRETERKALLDFKGSLVDEDHVMSSWTGRNCCSWSGITCHSHTGFVHMIDLSNNYPSVLGGHINSSLLQLGHLEYLDLSYNNFSWSPIPEFIGSLRNLHHLSLMNAGFYGEVPRHLGNLSNLKYLSLGDDGSSSLSSKNLNWIKTLSSLTSLELSFINLSESIHWLDSINMLSSLSSLTIKYCGLIGMSLSNNLNLTSLVSIDLSFNNFNSSLYPNLLNLSSLNDINIENAGLRGPIPDLFQKLPALKSVDLSHNLLGSSFPHSLCTQIGLTDLYFTRSDLHGSIPSCIGNLTSLTWLLLGGNDLSGAIPSELGSLTQLTNLYLGHNQLSGRIPSSLGKLTKLIELSVSYNLLIGELSESFFEGLKMLSTLDMSRNQFIALNVTSKWIPPFQIQDLRMDSVFIGLRPSFPAWLQTQTNLVILSLRNTSIFGVVPDWCQTSYPDLQYFDVSRNYLTSPFPTFNVINKETLQTLEISNNGYTGKIPEELCNLRSMTLLKLANNQLTGKIPSCLGSLQNLVVLDLASNSLSDHIPNEFGLLNILSILHLNGNKLIGEVPSSLQNLTELETLDLSNNELQGFIPNWIGKEFLFLEHLMLQSNHFSGDIPLNLCQLPSLQILNLPDNNLGGTIPPCLGNLSKMKSNDVSTDFDYGTPLTITTKGLELDYYSSLKYAKFISLSGNHLHGNIPNELMDLTGLQSLNLSNNELSGKIPETIGNMKYLESLDLSMNHFFGNIPQNLSDIDDLGYLNLSFNNFGGKIPSGGHFDTFDNPSIYEGNAGLCGKPTTKSCDGGDSMPSKQNKLIVFDDESEFEIEWIYAGIGPGFAVGLLGVFCLLYFKSSWRHVLFRFLLNVYNKF